MLRKKQSSILVNGKTVYKAETPYGWAIVIMPANILIDNYHIDNDLNLDKLKKELKQ